MRYLSIFLLIVLLASCDKKQTNSYKVSLFNRSGYDIEIMPYKAGKLNNADIIILTGDNTSQHVINTGIGEDFGTEEIFLPASFRGSDGDSIVVIFNGRYRVVHYLGTHPVNPLPKSYNWQSGRNVSNINNYIRSTEGKRTKQLETTFDYVFTTDDYIFASK